MKNVRPRGMLGSIFFVKNSLNSKNSLISAMALMLLLFHCRVYPASVIPMSLQALTQSADTVVVAQCADVQTRWLGSKIVTDSTLHISERIKGTGDGNLIITTLGGTAMHPRLNVPVNMSVSGGVSFTPGQEVLVFTKENRRGEHQVVGLSQGKFDISDESDSGKKFIPVGLKILTTQTEAENLDAPGWNSDEWFSPFALLDDPDNRLVVRDIALEEMLVRIRQYMAENP